MKSFGVDAEWIPVEERCHWGNDRNETVAKPPAKRGIGPGCWPTEVGGPAGRLRAAWRAHGVQMTINGI